MPTARENTPIPLNLLLIACAWLRAAINLLRIRSRGVEVSKDTVKEALVLTVGDEPTFGLLARMNAADFLAALPAPPDGPLVPSNVRPVLEGFVRAWTPETPRCTSCGLPGLTARLDRTGVDAHGVGEVCPHGSVEKPCRGRLERSAAEALTLRAWTTRREVPGGTTVDRAISPGEEIPLTNEGLRALPMKRPVLALLDGEGVEAIRWAEHLLHSPRAAVDLGGVASLAGVMDLLKADLVKKRGEGVVVNAIRAAREGALGGPFADSSCAVVVPESNGKPRVLLAYVPEDANIARQIVTHTTMVWRTDATLLDVGKIGAGENRAAVIAGWVAVADVVLVVGSADFFASDEMQQVIEPAIVRYEADKQSLRIVPVLARAFNLAQTSLERFQEMPRGRSLYRFDPIDEGLALVAEGIRLAVKALTKKTQRLVALPLDTLLELHAAALSAGLVAQRGAMLGGLSPSFIASISLASSPGAQLNVDIQTLSNNGPALLVLADGSLPIVTWLKNAIHLAGPRLESLVFKRVLATIEG